MSQEFMDAVRLRFALIDVKMTQKALSVKEPKEQELAIHNELKIITASEEVYSLWSDLISAHSEGELMDPDSGKRFKELPSWNQERDGVMT
jgi:hypothetical protein